MSRHVVVYDTVETNGGRADVIDWDFSYIEDRVLRLSLDGLFVVQVTLPETYYTDTFMVCNIERVVSSEVEEKCCYERLYFDQDDCDYIRRCSYENIMSEDKSEGIIDGKKVSFHKYWEVRLEQVIESGCRKGDLVDLLTDLSFENLTQPQQAVQIPQIILHIPCYSRDENNVVVPTSLDDVSDIIDRMEYETSFCGYSIVGIEQGITYVV